jgi:putative transposase
VSQPNQVYIDDITYIYTQKGWLYLVIVIDLFSQKIVAGRWPSCADQTGEWQRFDQTFHTRGEARQAVFE